MTILEAQRELGLNDYQIYRAVRRGQLHAYQVGGRGRKYYAEWELRRLIGLYPDSPAEAA